MSPAWLSYDMHCSLLNLARSTLCLILAKFTFAQCQKFEIGERLPAAADR